MRIEHENDKSGAVESVRGSDNRMNVSARSDQRAYYNSRDEKQCYTMVWSHPAAAAGQYGLYLRNTSGDKEIVISSIGINSDTADVRIKLHFVTGTAADGVLVTPVNLNKASSNAADAIARDDGAGTTISGLTSAGVIDYLILNADGHEEMRLSDRVRLGQNDAIALELDEGGGGTADVFGVVFFYFE